MLACACRYICIALRGIVLLPGEAKTVLCERRFNLGKRINIIKATAFLKNRLFTGCVYSCTIRKTSILFGVAPEFECTLCGT